MALLFGNQATAVPQESSRGSLRRLQSLLAPAKKSEHKDEEEDQDFEEPELDRCTDEEDDEECEERTGKIRGGMTEVELMSRAQQKGQGRQKQAMVGGAQIAWSTVCKSSGRLQASLSGL